MDVEIKRWKTSGALADVASISKRPTRIAVSTRPTLWCC
jgi:hypothetical protein